ncbi:VOC family protein [Leptobacterium flavescens]|nr:VOC family protein [Leptobacterium flavescens]
MKKIYLFSFSLLLNIAVSWAQPGTEVYLFKLSKNLELSTPQNTSGNPGFYDNQPSFLNNNTLLFSSTRNGQTDIRKVGLDNGEDVWITATDGSEYSPLKIPGREAASSIRLDKDGKQLLYAYNFKDGKPEVLVNDLVIGYHVWFDKDHIVSFVLGEESSLVVSDLKNGSNKTYQKKIGRSLHKIPGSKLISYISKENDQWEIRSLDPLTGNSKLIVPTLENAEDMCWTPDGTIIMGKGDTLYKYDPKTDSEWTKLISLSSFGLDGITRVSVSPQGDKIAVVVTEKPSEFQSNTIQMGVVVSDMERSLDFYKNILGMKETGGFDINSDFGKRSGLSNGLPFQVKILKLEDSPQANQFKLVSFGKKRASIPEHIQDDTGVQYITIFVNSVTPFLNRIRENNIELLGETPIKLGDNRNFLLIRDPDGIFVELIGND